MTKVAWTLIIYFSANSHSFKPFLCSRRSSSLETYNSIYCRFPRKKKWECFPQINNLWIYFGKFCEWMAAFAILKLPLTHNNSWNNAKQNSQSGGKAGKTHACSRKSLENPENWKSSPKKLQTAKRQVRLHQLIQFVHVLKS